MLINKVNITSLISQRAPIIMIDNLLEQNNGFTKTDLKIEKDNLFVRDGEFQESGIIENMAQTAAAGAGYHHQQKNTKPHLRYLGSVTKLRIHKYPKVGDLIQTTTEIKETVFNITLVKGSSLLNGELIAECEIKIVSGERPAETNY